MPPIQPKKSHYALKTYSQSIYIAYINVPTFFLEAVNSFFIPAEIKNNYK